MKNQIKLAAHRGFMTDYPENTMISYAKALECDIDMLEVDVHMTKDGQLIMMHDHTVDRTTNGTGWIKDLTFDEIRSLDAGSSCSPSFAGEKVPTFEEFLIMMQDYPDIEVNVELKDYPQHRGTDTFISVDKSLALLEKYNMTDRIYINSWSGEVLEYIAVKYSGRYRLHGYYPMFHNTGNYDRDTFYSKLYCACLFNATLDGEDKVVSAPHGDKVMAKEHFDYLKSIGVQPWVHFNPDTYPKIAAAAANGATGITSNDPITAAMLLDAVGARKMKR